MKRRGAAFLLSVVAASSLLCVPAKAALVDFSLSGVTGTFDIPFNIGGGVPTTYNGTMSISGSFVFNTTTDQISSISQDLSVSENTTNLGLQPNASRAYGASAANGNAPYSWVILTNDLFVGINFADDLALGTTDAVTGMTIYSGYGVGYASSVTGAAVPSGGSAVPEPASLILLASAAAIAGCVRRRAG